MAEFRAAAVFSNNMVLQREKNICIFGEGNDGQEVKVELNGAKAKAVVKNGRWNALLPPMAAGDGYEMKISCGEKTICFTNIAIGEVWLAGGQSNMELELRNCKGGADVLKNDKNPNVRFYYTQKRAYMNEEFYEAEKNTGWSEFGENEARAWSAVGYFFARKLAAELGVIVGVIGCNWGGTSATAWMPRKSIEADKELISYIDDFNNATRGKTEQQQIDEYNEYIAYAEEWDKKANECYAKQPDISWEDVQKICGENKWPGPMGISNPYRPNGLYECMLKRVMPYTLRGFIFYQGESDDHKPRLYFKLFSRMIEQWRNDWEDDELPLLFVQLPMHKYAADPDYKHWCYIREAQMRVFKTVKNTGIAVIPDFSEFNEIHPKEKVPVGERLALQALYSVYKTISADVAFGPIYKSFEYKNNGIELSFDYADNGLVSKGELNGFEIAGDDKTFYPAKAEIIGNRIFAISENVNEPKYLRYCWSNYIDVTVFGKNGIPLAPFRTSMLDEDVAEAPVKDEKEIRQVMEL